MSYTLNLSDGERIVYDETVEINSGETVRFAVTDRAVYLPAKRFFAVSDDTYLRRIPLSEIREVSIRWIGSYSGVFITGLMFSLAFVALETGFYGRVIIGLSGVLLALVSGIKTAAAAWTRHGLIFRMQEGRYIWRPPLRLNKAAKRGVSGMMLEFVEACRQAGVTVGSKHLSGVRHTEST